MWYGYMVKFIACGIVGKFFACLRPKTSRVFNEFHAYGVLNDVPTPSCVL